MDVTIEVIGNDPVNLASDLETWIRRERIRGLDRIQQESLPPKSGELGPTLLAILTIVLGSGAAIELVRSIHVWIAANNRGVSVRISRGTETIEISSSREEDVEKVLRVLKG